MTFPDKKKIESLRQVISKSSGGSTISAISSRTKMNRNLVAKYLDYLVHTGHLEMKIFGSSKVYTPSSRVPVSALVYHVFDPVIMLDQDQYIMSVNDQILALIDVKPENLIGKKLSGINNPVLTSLIRNSMPEINAGNPGNSIRFTTTIQGDSHCFTVKAIPVVYEDGMTGTAVIFHDISAEKKYRRIQDLNKIREDVLSEDQSEFVIRFLPDSSISFMNPAMSRFFKRKPGEYSGLTFRSVIPLEDHRALDHIISILNKEHPVNTFRCRIINPSGHVRYFDWTIRGLFSSDGSIYEYQCVGTDSTDKYAALETINKYNDDQAILYKMSYEFSVLPKDVDIYDMIGKGLKEILPSAIVGVNTLDFSTMALTSRCFLDDRDREIFSRYLGKDIVGYPIESPDTVERSHIIQNVMGGKLIKVPGNLFVMMLGQIPAETCEKIEHHLNIGDMYIIGLVSGNHLFGNVGLFLRKGEILKRNEIIEIFVRHVSLALKCRYLEEGKTIPNMEMYSTKSAENGLPDACLPDS